MIMGSKRVAIVTEISDPSYEILVRGVGLRFAGGIF